MHKEEYYPSSDENQFYWDKYEEYEQVRPGRSGGRRKSERMGDKSMRRLSEIHQEGSEQKKYEQAISRIRATFPSVDVDTDEGFEVFGRYVEYIKSIESGSDVLRKEDEDIDKVSGTGSGGQNVNRKKRGVRITHVPTGIQKVTRDKAAYDKNLRDVRAALAEELALLREAWKVVLQRERKEGDSVEQVVWRVKDRLQ